jgi:ribulose-5-phosphate 4-epimerase/fuculose-1-phosphate aldolase/ubiquinone/menaquinone biosynthesis C-methylase UbiE
MLEVLVTSGGTISRIDDIRHIGNFSKGHTGSHIAEAFLHDGAIVHYVYSKGAKRPFREKLAINPENDFESELDKVKEAYGEFQKYQGNLYEHQIESFQDYYETVKNVLIKESIDVVVLAAAVSDYGVKKQEGKISSDFESLSLTLSQNPKVISRIKKCKPNVFQVGFKLLSGVGLDELIDVAYRHSIKNHSNLTVANTINENFGKRSIVFITPEKGILPVSAKELAPRLVEVVNQRISKQHYRTKVDIDTTEHEQTNRFKQHVQKLWKLNLFEPYYKNSDMHFGFVAERVEDGFLITSRGSNKKDMPLEDIVYVPKVDFDSRTVYVQSSGKKASLNANVAAKIFEEKPEINSIVHAHVFPGVENRTKTDYSPGTEEDVREVINHLGNEKIVELVNHGIIAVGEDIDNVISTLDVEPAYTRFPGLYDIIYGRFQQSPDFVDLVAKTVKKDEFILDLAAGTGDVTSQLLKNGYKDICLADRSNGMLNVARSRIDVPVFNTSIEAMDLGIKFDAVVIRQAINYLMNYGNLVAGLRQIYAHLNPNGRLIFNAPNYTEGQNYGDKNYEYNAGGFHVKIREMNLIEGRVVTHTQNCVLIKQDVIKKLYDLNRFGLFTKEEFEQALLEAGFRPKFFGKGLHEYDTKSKALYCVAES